MNYMHHLKMSEHYIHGNHDNKKGMNLEENTLWEFFSSETTVIHSFF